MNISQVYADLLSHCDQAEKELRVRFERKVDGLLSSKEKEEDKAENKVVNQINAETSNRQFDLISLQGNQDLDKIKSESNMAPSSSRKPCSSKSLDTEQLARTEKQVSGATLYA